MAYLKPDVSSHYQQFHELSVVRGFADPTPVYLSVPVDHFDPTNFDMWQTRYVFNDTFWNGTGPVICTSYKIYRRALDIVLEIQVYLCRSR
jgi:hypothetical protein